MQKTRPGGPKPLTNKTRSLPFINTPAPSIRSRFASIRWAPLSDPLGIRSACHRGGKYERRAPHPGGPGPHLSASLRKPVKPKAKSISTATTSPSPSSSTLLLLLVSSEVADDDDDEVSPMATREVPLLLLLLVVMVLAGAGAARGFYLPGVAPRDFRKVWLTHLLFSLS